MINSAAARDYLLRNLPQLCLPAPAPGKALSIYGVIHSFAQYTSRAAAQDSDAAAHCLQLAARLHREGDAVVSGAIENVFVYALDRIFLQAGNGHTAMRERIPAPLCAVYMRQVMQAGC